MELLYDGKTKRVSEIEDEGICIFNFKDTYTGDENGNENSGGNEVAGSREDLGKATLEVSTFFFEFLTECNIPNHFISSNLKTNEMKVRKARMIGKGLEFIKRYKATGSFIDRYGEYFEEGQNVNITEVTTKNDKMKDPPISEEVLRQANLLKKEEYNEIIKLFNDACDAIRSKLAEMGLDLWDMKLEIGKIQDESGNWIWAIIDEISAGVFRVYDAHGNGVGKEDVAKIILSKANV